MGKKKIAQQPLLALPEPEYMWVPVARLVQDDFIVIDEQEVKVQSVIWKNGEWHVSFLFSEVRSKAEQIYNAHDQVYAKATSRIKEVIATEQR